MFSRRMLLPFALLAFVSAIPAADPQVAHPEKLKAIPAAMQKFVDSDDISGSVTVVGRKDGVVAFDAVGQRDIIAKAPMTKETMFRIASMTKPVTAIGIMILADEGKLSPDDDVVKHLPEFTGQLLREQAGGLEAVPGTFSFKKPKRAVKIRDLLTHTSGVAGYPKGVDDVYLKRNRTLAETTLATALQPLTFEPGSRWKYSNEGIDVLGRVIEVVSGESYENFLKKRIFDPLGLKDTTFYPTKERRDRVALTYFKGRDGKLFVSKDTLMTVPEGAKHPVPAGGLFSTGDDLAKLYRMMLNKGEFNGKRILSEKAVAEMTKVQTGMLKTGFVD